MNLTDTNFLFASLVWGSVGVGYCLYGRRQRSWVPMVGGLLMVGGSYAIGSALLMSLVSLAIMAAVYFLLRRGY